MEALRGCSGATEIQLCMVEAVTSDGCDAA